MNTTDKTAKLSKETNARATAELLWLSYFNETLYSKGMITEALRNRMKVIIKNRNVLKK